MQFFFDVATMEKHVWAIFFESKKSSAYPGICFPKKLTLFWEYNGVFLSIKVKKELIKERQDNGISLKCHRFYN